MKLIKNTGDDRVIDALRAAASPSCTLDIASSDLSLFASDEASQVLQDAARCRMVLPDGPGRDLELFGGDGDRPFRNRLTASGLARRLGKWLEANVEVRGVSEPISQSLIAVGNGANTQIRVLTGECSLTTNGLGLTPGRSLSLIQCAETPEECSVLGSWFQQLWNSLPQNADAKHGLLMRLGDLAAHKAPSLVYFLILFHLFRDLHEELDEERIAVPRPLAAPGPRSARPKPGDGQR